ncbi:hypothetical protein HPT25_26700 [Bacillus sp. BRMEA1]|uniref:tetratricopeptide repeat protein n=1 Tax=Neobacillus endophyticus TaxID=2738405 RepID=UPI001564299A|nr:hypothetical protein [Neobacillus endophyticus]NRD80918.1 hypothetical protein [Neobacillus endophyticus]
MKQPFFNCLNNGDIKSAEIIILSQPKNVVQEWLVEYGFDTNSITAYTFAWQMIQEDESADNHFFASTLMATALCHMTGGYATALYHARRAVELNPEDIDLWEWLLFFYEIPDKLVSREEAEVITKKVLEVKPDSEPAKATLNFDTWYQNKSRNDH